LKTILIAGTASGVGKTSIATGLMGALNRRGLKVQPFKTGPDYIDPGYHTAATGEISRNLDTWMLSRESILELFNRAALGKDIAVIEGVMGLFDGRTATTDEGSTAELAKILAVPVLLVLDARKGARSLAAIAAGYRDFDPSLNLAGVILNGIGSDHHLALCKDAIEHYTHIPVVGHLPRRSDLSIPERHLGLVPTAERPAEAEFLNSLISQCELTLDIPSILSICDKASVPQTEPRLFPLETVPTLSRIAVARDKAFSFYYQDNLDLLQAWGAEIVTFSPISDPELPPAISGLYIGGGFPELYAEQLASNISMKNSVRLASQRGLPIYAECGGLMYLSQQMRDLQGRQHAMTGVLPVEVRIDTPRLSLGYRTVRALADNPLLRKGETVRGHEFHWSVLSAGSDSANAYELVGSGRKEGFLSGNTLASYVHVHMASNPGMARRLIDFCRSRQATSL
jgi:cobyrinic acid a,c-diamide synthase